MPSIVLLNNVDHADLRVVATRGAAWGDDVNVVPIFPTEFEAAQRDFPILFRRDEDGQGEALAILGLDRDENLFLDGDRWSARYVPALLERGPFSIGLRRGEGGVAEPMIHIDLHDPRVRDHAGGQALFLPHGGNAPYLDHVAGVLQTIHVGHAAQTPMFDAFAAEGLLEPAEIAVTVDDGLQYDLTGFHTIGAEALAALDGEALARLHAQGFLALAIHAMSSLGNFQRLIALKSRRRAQA